MALTANVRDCTWSVDVSANPAPEGGYRAKVRVAHHDDRGAFTHEFQHSGTFVVEREALLAGLREGMAWIELKMSGALHI
ncbi:MAG TPA: UDP-glucose 4-epimerase [Paraburkholderia sp.]|jgi:hypothetical protein|nr:UDP-glucose 4-epimerase [Paraburkholderia sp.]